MSGEANTVIVCRMFEEIFNQGKLALVETWVATTFLNHAAPVHMLRGLESLKEHVILLRIAFPDLHFTVEALIADEERVAVRVGVFRGFPPTNKTFVRAQMHIVRFVKGKAVEHWTVRNELSLMQQIGILPSSG